MKPSINKSDKKRKRDETPNPQESPKRNKVHAQRKFAQGVGVGGASTSPLKERDRANQQRHVTPPAEPILTSRVPNTGDFLTFLCFQSSPMLPPEMNFFRETSGPEAPTASTSQPHQKNSVKPVSKKKKKEPIKKPATAVQALRQKYQEQRLAKQKATSVTILAKKVKGKNLIRTRSSAVAEEAAKAVKTTKKRVVGLRSGLQRAAPPGIAAKKKELMRVGLRSGARIHEPKTSAKEQKKDVPSNKKKQESLPQEKQESKAIKKKKPQGEHGSDFSSDDNEPLLTSKGSSRPSLRSQKGRMSNIAVRLSRRSKIAATSYMQKLSKKLASPTGDDDPSSAESFSEQSNSRKSGKFESGTKNKSAVKKPPLSTLKSKNAKQLLLKRQAKKPLQTEKDRTTDTSIERPSTRSRSQGENKSFKGQQILKPAIRSLIQRKKQNSLRTLTRLGKSKRLLSEKIAKKPDVRKASAKTEGSSSITPTEKEAEPAVRKLRRKNAPTVLNHSEKNLRKIWKKPVLKKKAKNPESLKKKGDSKTNEKVEITEEMSKRPVRKCSTIDKIWIDVDGFTSDEDDFIDLESIAEGKVSVSNKKGDDGNSGKGSSSTGANNSSQGKSTQSSSSMTSAPSNSSEGNNAPSQSTNKTGADKSKGASTSSSSSTKTSTAKLTSGPRTLASSSGSNNKATTQISANSSQSSTAATTTNVATTVVQSSACVESRSNTTSRRNTEKHGDSCTPKTPLGKPPTLPNISSSKEEATITTTSSTVSTGIMQSTSIPTLTYTTSAKTVVSSSSTTSKTVASPKTSTLRSKNSTSSGSSSTSSSKTSHVNESLAGQSFSEKDLKSIASSKVGAKQSNMSLLTSKTTNNLTKGSNLSSSTTSAKKCVSHDSNFKSSHIATPGTGISDKNTKNVSPPSVLPHRSVENISQVNEAKPVTASSKINSCNFQSTNLKSQGVNFTVSCSPSTDVLSPFSSKKTFDRLETAAVVTPPQQVKRQRVAASHETDSGTVRIKEEKPNTTLEHSILPTDHLLENLDNDTKDLVKSSERKFSGSSENVSSKLVTSGTTSPRSSKEDSHSLIARLAASVSMSAPPMKSSYDSKLLTKDVNNSAKLTGKHCEGLLGEPSLGSIKKQSKDDEALSPDDKKIVFSAVSTKTLRDTIDTDKEKVRVPPKILPKLTATFVPHGIKTETKPIWPRVQQDDRIQPKNVLTSETDSLSSDKESFKSSKRKKPEPLFLPNKSLGLLRKRTSRETNKSLVVTTSSDSDDSEIFPVKTDEKRVKGIDRPNVGIGNRVGSESWPKGKPDSDSSGLKKRKQPVTGKRPYLKRDEKLSKNETNSRKGNSRGNRSPRPKRPTPEAVTRKERPKRQCSTVNRSWIDRDSDDSSFYDDNEDFMELIRQSELAEKEKEMREKLTEERSECDKVSEKESDKFSDSDDEPLKKKFTQPILPASLSSPSSTFDSNIKSIENYAQINNEGKCEPSRVTIPPPINTHGLDLLSEAVTEAEKSSLRIEQWLKNSARGDNTTAFRGFDASEIHPLPRDPTPCIIPDPLVQFVRATADAPRLQVPDEVEKLVKRSVTKPEIPPKRPPVSSVQGLLKLQKERREIPKPTTEQQHSSNCKCNSCVVKKGWFKNKPIPDSSKLAAKEIPSVKPFQSLTRAFASSSSGKASASVAPFVQNAGNAEIKSPQRKMSFLERMRERERKEASAKPMPSAFSPSNESSVYAFEPEPEQKDLRRSNSRTIPTSTQGDDDERTSHQSTSIAVQVNLDTITNSPPEPTPPADDGKSIEISTQTEVAEDDADSPMFYIPLQQSTVTTSTQPLIQGVALKLGTEGPLGPHQRVIMKAKLLTKAPTAPSMKAVVMPQQKLTEAPKNAPPVGTVQPTARRPAPHPVVPNPYSKDEVHSAISTRAKKAKVEETPKPEVIAKVSPPSVQQPALPVAPKASPLKELKPAPSAKCLSPPLKPKIGGKGSAELVEAPTFYLTEKEFQDPLEFFDRIRPEAERFGLCRIVPPSSFKPDCKVADDMRFTAYNQYVHRMFHRWGPTVCETMALKKYLKTQRISLKPPPCIAGMEVDLPRLYKAVQVCGGLMKVIERQKWQHVADMLRFPRAAHDLTTKLDSIYCQYLLPYETLKSEEREQLLKEVADDWEAHQKKQVTETEGEEEDDDENYIEECEECIVKGRTMALNQFYRIARNTMSMWFKSSEPSPTQVETEFWRTVTDRTNHVCVHSASIDSSGWGYGFPVGKNNFAKHPWNLKVLTNNSGSVLRSLGPVMGVTVPTLHVGMVFTAFCWYRDPHGLPWIEYLHTGAPKIWYGISDDNSELFREALTTLLPRHIKNQRIWLPCDTSMAPPDKLTELGVPLSRTTQEPGQFIIIFPRAFTSSVCTGYLVSESVYFARPSWLETAEQAFRDIHNSTEPSVFSLDNLLFSIAADTRASLDVLQLVLPMVRRVRERELEGRKALQELGISRERLPREVSRRRSRITEQEPDEECEKCRASLFLSFIKITTDESTFCLTHGVQHLTAHSDQLEHSKLFFIYDEDELNQVAEKLEERIGAKLQKSKK